ncbi:MAG TPA: hypothetical protein VLX92_18155 [Kofleriaceae bacterium]|nr:hypothetical protein [Kofleriaceae bacterium]
MLRACPVALVVAVAVAVAPRGARADAPEEPSIWLGGGLELLPFGTSEIDIGNLGFQSDAATAFGVNAIFEYRLGHVFTVGFAHRLVLDVHDTETHGDSAELFDLRGRLTGRWEFLPGWAAYGAVMVGYGILSLPKTSDPTQPSPGTSKGPTVTFAAGVTYNIGPYALVYTEVGFENGFEGYSMNGTSYDYEYNFPHVEAGMMFAIGD